METQEQTIWRLLHSVIDPELGCNIVDLGLVYGFEVNAGHLVVIMTLTTPGCPMHDSIASGVVRLLATVDGVTDVDVKIVWEPAWHPGMMTESARQQLGVR